MRKAFYFIAAMTMAVGLGSCGDDDEVVPAPEPPAATEEPVTINRLYGGDMNILVEQGDKKLPCTPTTAQAVLNVSKADTSITLKPFKIEVPDYGPMTIITGEDLLMNHLGIDASYNAETIISGPFCVTMPTDMGRGGFVDYEVKGTVSACFSNDSLVFEIAIPPLGWGPMPFAMTINFEGGVQQ